MRIGHVVYVAPQPNWHFPSHEHQNAVELSFLRNGTGTFFHNSKPYTVTKGDLIVKNAGLNHAERSDCDAPMDQICIEIYDVNIDGLEPNHMIPEGISPVISFSDHYDLLYSGFTFLRDYSHVEGYDKICLKLLETIVEMIQAKVRPPVGFGVNKKPPRKELMAYVKQYVDQHYRDKLSTGDIAAEFYVSEGHLSRQFKSYTGQTLRNYITDKRMGEARKMLIFSEDDIKDVAIACGYSDIQYFYHVFKRSAGCTPGEYRRNYSPRS